MLWGQDLAALQPWQGIDTLFKAFVYLKDLDNINLVICSSHKEQHSKYYKKLSQKLGIEKKVIWRYQLSQKKLYSYIQHALFTVAPLIECSRNLSQGCSPIKIFESMACNTAVIASDLPVVREIIEPGVNGKLFKPGQPGDLARCMRILIDYPDFRKKLAFEGKMTIFKNNNWTNIKAGLSKIYDEIINPEIY